uniref:Uncharacterized protein n=1 Tax=Saccharum spontaneum TaxID=62335 RepID=A0A678TPX4_SACSP|nr:hypothetical protein SS29K18_000006 [Saccharum spontaneum]
MNDCTHQPMPNPEPASPAPAPAPTAAPPQEATGDSESDTPVSGLSLTVGDRPLVAAGYAEDDAELCSGADNNCVPAASVDADDGRGADDDAAMEGDENEVDSRMSVPWWRRTVQDAAAGAGAGGGCARPQAAAEGGAAVAAGGSHATESNRLFWEACIAHGY